MLLPGCGGNDSPLGKPEAFSPDSLLGPRASARELTDVALYKGLECDVKKKKEKADISANYYNSLQLATSNWEIGKG